MDRCNNCYNPWNSPISSACNNGGCDKYHSNEWHCHDQYGRCIEGHQDHCSECHDSCDCRIGEE